MWAQQSPPVAAEWLFVFGYFRYCLTALLLLFTFEPPLSRQVSNGPAREPQTKSKNVPFGMFLFPRLCCRRPRSARRRGHRKSALESARPLSGRIHCCRLLLSKVLGWEAASRRLEGVAEGKPSSAHCSAALSSDNGKFCSRIKRELEPKVERAGSSWRGWL